MVCDDTDGDVGLVFFAVLAACQRADFISERADRVHVKEGCDVLHGDRQTLQAHARIDILVLELRVIAVSVVVELGEYDVPDFHESVAFAAHDVLGTIPPLFAAVIVDLSAGAAGAGAVLPEVVGLAELVDALGRDVHIVEPDIVGLVIAFVYGRIESLGIQADPLGQELPCPRDRLFFEIVAKREIAQHLEEGAVSGRFADVLQVAGADALLAGGHAPSGRDLLTGEVRL